MRPIGYQPGLTASQPQQDTSLRRRQRPRQAQVMAYGTFVSEMPQYRLHPVLAAGREIYREADHAILVDRLAYLHGVGEARAVQRLAQTLRRILRILPADHAKAGEGPDFGLAA